MKLPPVTPKAVQGASAFSKQVLVRHEAFDEALKHDQLWLRHCVEMRMTSRHPNVLMMSMALSYRTMHLACAEAKVAMQPSNDDVFRTIHLETLALASPVPIMQRIERDQPIMFEVFGRWLTLAPEPTIAIEGITRMYRIVELLPEPLKQA